MSRSRAVALAIVCMLWSVASASADTLRCQSVDGNVNCAGPGGQSCQTVNGRTVCVSGHGDVVQTFDHAASSNPSDDDADDAGLDGAGSAPRAHPAHPNHTFLLQRDGDKLRLRTDRLSIDRE